MKSQGDIVVHPEPSSSVFDVRIDIDDVYLRWPLADMGRKAPMSVLRSETSLTRFYRNRCVPLRLRNAVWNIARRTRLDEKWYKVFKYYWENVLRVRALWSVYDFHFVRNWYRMKFANQHLPETEDVEELLRAWQCPEMIHQLLHYVGREVETNELRVWLSVMRHLGPGMQSFLEYGCAIGRVTKTYDEFFGWRRRTQAYIADIKTQAFHFAAWRFGGNKCVHPLLLKAEDGFQLAEEIEVDVVFCIEVFEHLNRPLDAVQRLLHSIRPGGLLVFDYIAGDGGAWDTKIGQAERREVLLFVERNFDIVQGRLEANGTTGLTIARRR